MSSEVNHLIDGGDSLDLRPRAKNKNSNNAQNATLEPRQGGDSKEYIYVQLVIMGDH